MWYAGNLFFLTWYYLYRTLKVWTNQCVLDKSSDFFFFKSHFKVNNESNYVTFNNRISGLAVNHMSNLFLPIVIYRYHGRGSIFRHD